MALGYDPGRQPDQTLRVADRLGHGLGRPGPARSLARPVPTARGDHKGKGIIFCGLRFVR